MKTNSYFTLLYVILTILQLVICNYLGLSQFLTLSLLPAMVFCLPLSVNTFWAMIIAFVTGLCVDGLGDGLLGLNAFALVPVALIRRPLVSGIFGSDVVERNGHFSIYNNGLFRCAGAVAICTAIFFFLYILVDGAGTRPFWFSLVRFLCSFLLSTVFGVIVLNVLNPRERR